LTKEKKLEPARKKRVRATYFSRKSWANGPEFPKITADLDFDPSRFPFLLSDTEP